MTSSDLGMLRKLTTEASLIFKKENRTEEDQEILDRWVDLTSPELILNLIDRAERPLIPFTAEQQQAVAEIGTYAQRVLRAQDITQGSVAMYNSPEGKHPIPALHVAAVLHSLADFTHNQHMVNVIIDQQILARESNSFAPRASSLGRYFHRLADAIEWKELDSGTSQA